MSEPHGLSDAPAPGDRACLVRDAEGFTLSLSPAPSWKFAVRASVGVGVAIWLLVAAAYPFAANEWPLRILYGCLGLWILLRFADAFASRRGWTTLTVRERTLTITMKAAFGCTETSYALWEYRDVTTSGAESDAPLVLIRNDGREYGVLENDLYPAADVALAAKVLREEVRRGET